MAFSRRHNVLGGDRKEAYACFVLKGVVRYFGEKEKKNHSGSNKIYLKAKKKKENPDGKIRGLVSAFLAEGMSVAAVRRPEKGRLEGKEELVSILFRPEFSGR